MSWAKLDDGLPENLKIEPLSDAAFRAYVTSICYAARNLTDGFVTHKKAKEFAGKPRVIQELVPHLWQVVDDGYMIHDFLVYNPTRESVLKKRAADSARKSQRNPDGIQTESARNPTLRARDPDPSPPVPLIPTPHSRPSTERVLLERPNIFKLYEQLLGKGVSPLVADRLKDYEASHSEECIEHCFVEAAESNARNIKLVYAILDRHQAEGCYAERPNHTTPGRPAAQRAGDARELTGSELAVIGRLGLLDPPKRISVGADVVEEPVDEYPRGVEVGVETR